MSSSEYKYNFNYEKYFEGMNVEKVVGLICGTTVLHTMIKRTPIQVLAGISGASVGMSLGLCININHPLIASKAK